MTGGGIARKTTRLEKDQGQTAGLGGTNRRRGLNMWGGSQIVASGGNLVTTKRYEGGGLRKAAKRRR